MKSFKGDQLNINIVKIYKSGIMASEPENPYNMPKYGRLAELAISDAHHDKLIKVNDTYKRLIKSGFPLKDGNDVIPVGDDVSDMNIKGEDGLFNQFMINEENETFITALHKKNQGKDIEIKFKKNEGPDQLVYKTTIFQSVKGDTDRKFKNGDREFENFGDFNSYVDLFGDQDGCNFVVDFNQCGFLNTLSDLSKKGGPSVGKKYMNYLYTSEVINDPAGKPHIEGIMFEENKDTPYQMRSLVECTVHDSGITVPGNDKKGRYVISNVYPKFDETSTTMESKFFSKYDFMLSAPMKDYNARSEKYYVQGKITHQYSYDKKNVSAKNAINIESNIDSSETENSNAKVSGYIISMFQAFSKLKQNGPTRERQLISFNFNSKVQHKRSGDWLQALCITQIDNKQFTTVKPVTGDILNGTELSKLPTYFVTHDRVALAYAMEIGVNIIYLKPKGEGMSVYVLKSEKDERLQQNVIKKYNNHYDSFKKTVSEFYEKSICEDIVIDNKPLSFFKLYSDLQFECLKKLKVEYNDNILQKINDLGVEDMKIILTDNSSENKIVEIISNLIKFYIMKTFIYKSLPIISEHFTIIKNLRQFIINLQSPDQLQDDDESRDYIYKTIREISQFEKSIYILSNLIDRLQLIT